MIRPTTLGGDYYDYFTAGDDEVMVVIGDVTGHGFGPSLLMAETRAALRTMAATTNDIGTMMGQVNGLIHDHDFGWFVTLFLARIHLASGLCKYASAGQPALLRRADGSILDLRSTDHPLGIIAGTDFQVSELALCDGDLLLLYTDGITERSAGPNQFYGTERIEKHLAEAKNRSAVETLDHIFDDANRYADFRPPVDDMTAVVVKVGTGEAQQPPDD